MSTNKKILKKSVSLEDTDPSMDFFLLDLFKYFQPEISIRILYCQ